MRFAKIVTLTLLSLVLLALVIPPLLQGDEFDRFLFTRFVSAGSRAKGENILQVGKVSTLSAAVASATRAEVVAAPASGSIYLRGIVVEKSTGATGTVTISSGAGTNCATGNAVLIGPITNPAIGLTSMATQVPAAKALCLATDAATTSVRALAQ